MVNTVDFITPPVDDPYWFGQIAAANSISDIYSMGGRPLTALNVVMFPSNILDKGILKDILRGGNDKVTEAGACLVGGHSVDDNEPKYGLCVNGIVHPNRIITNAGAKPGDALILTKPIGSGVLFNAVRSGKYSFKELERQTLPSIAALNGGAMEKALCHELHAATDITGFGILGHALEMAVGSGVQIILDYKAFSFYPGAYDMYKKGVTTGSNRANRALAQRHPLTIARDLTKAQEDLLFDPQTSGGLILSLPEAQAAELLGQLHEARIDRAAIVGRVAEGTAGIIVE
jgi:selenide, water dikinase